MKDNGKHIAEYEFSIGLRLTHWIRAISIVLLIVSGFYIAYVFVSPVITSEPTNFMNAKWRAVHQIVGFVLIGCFIFKLYLFFFDKKSHIERVSLKDFLSPKVWIDQIKYYMFMGKHPHLVGTYNPLQFVSYLFFYIILFVICLTGLILYVHVYHEGLGGLLYDPMRAVEAWMGGLANVRVVHHISMWIIMIFVLVHVYMAIYNAIKGKNGAMDAIVSGYKFPKED
ncbi:Ni/Fe-hydrogenase, b-type cytochrome subunit [Campylobacter hyointestinalis]|uniref:Ni/Fe-hydrogenase, b-type cytochrome subunit n=1 Tax=Campylobacter hyointestinalis subsp. hyointestinalis TaxID=91352 RepID=A0A855NGG1_CAMHY|nr:Ni/Fe-hydrogenase, b-type cytochrome subunit [Campylobacter hyointestinalis]ANE32644.1 [NiFe] hydrogenase, cytochrome b subunit [Campylobacter hyointestinalis subsp. hyointestinalis LMG 9260]KEA45022.1 Ni/Fe hydrogenase [Campylobacter hyointestinalis subsp. hyointestinalis]MDL2346777.1 Ni/Fe-hydrogenase, b-type cytochrome subunit [Campylobacter hyointestinalis]MDL2348612.1 Ni/Fe-hydrogenase, b-type cytochrome subunit [Campylobacter hyointestinalis]MDL2350263.1 Ni/Fe-hydrogenase, b-type cyto